LTLAGVLVGIVATYLMTTAYHPFGGGGVLKNWFRCMGMFITFQWKSAVELIGDVASFGELNKEDRAKSLLGIYILGFSFALQTVGAALAIADIVEK